MCYNDRKYLKMKGFIKMDIRIELLTNSMCDIIKSKLNELDIDLNTIAQTTAIAALSEIQKVLQDKDLSDFNMIEEIVLIFEKYHIDCGACHDFG